jgi:hypothetical protein
VGYCLAIRCAGQFGIRSWAIIFAGAVLLITAAFSRPVAWAGDPRAFLSLSVNGIDCGTVIAVVRSADVLLPTDDLKKAGLSLSGAKSETTGRRSGRLGADGPR